jgi:hypothetical protein
VIDGDAKRLEHTRRRIDAAPTLCLHTRDETTEIVR